MMTMFSSRPYLIRALYEWIADNNMTPHLLVDARHPGVEVPSEHVQDGRIVLNVNATAVQGLVMGNEWLSFGARFGGMARNIRVPIAAVMAIYARENGQGMAFGSEPGDGGPSPADDAQSDSSGSERKKPRPALKVVK